MERIRSLFEDKIFNCAIFLIVHSMSMCQLYSEINVHGNEWVLSHPFDDLESQLQWVKVHFSGLSIDKTRSSNTHDDCRA